MPPGEVRLAIDCGSVTTAAVLVWPDGQWQVLRFDDRPVLSSAVFVRPNGRMVAGEDAWQQAVATVEGLFVPSPVRRIREEAISSGAVTVAGVDVVAEPLRQVAQVAGLVVGGPISDVRLVVPAGWGPAGPCCYGRRRTAQVWAWCAWCRHRSRSPTWCMRSARSRSARTLRCVTWAAE
ncbi:hypothetical protein Phou_062530 [Phytohabitans houttuyneae]|uniref:Uncharacterized protein n=1 Tax=Phytohabitans houttuyneae TaxID=1076126 RepID=A0A6V8KA28_9ACTN|nr:hypothetical protein Phou_062530 [Phytohabitans houttuyneae]